MIFFVYFWCLVSLLINETNCARARVPTDNCVCVCGWLTPELARQLPPALEEMSWEPPSSSSYCVTLSLSSVTWSVLAAVACANLIFLLTHTFSCFCHFCFPIIYYTTTTTTFFWLLLLSLLSNQCVCVFFSYTQLKSRWRNFLSLFLILLVNSFNFCSCSFKSINKFPYTTGTLTFF